jgi:putative two-component system response regulator
MGDKKRVILAADDITDLSKGKETLSPHYEALTVSSGAKFFLALGKFQPDLILLDAGLPRLDSFGTLRRIKAGRCTADIPVIFLMARDDCERHEKAFRAGAADIVLKPYQPATLRKTVERHLTMARQKRELEQYRQSVEDLATKRNSSIILIQDALLDTLAAIAGNKKYLPELYRAGMQRKYLTAMREEMQRQGVYRQETRRFHEDSFIASAQLHDVGKIVVQDDILQKPGKLTPVEFEEVKKHTGLGVKVIEQIGQNAVGASFFDHAKLFAASHHERWDGSGYPLGLKAKDIPLQGRLMAIVDVYDALISQRPYKPALTHAQARGIIAANSGTHFDPLLVEVFLGISDQFAAL